jgi:hypothetical protein
VLALALLVNLSPTLTATLPILVALLLVLLTNSPFHNSILEVGGEPDFRRVGVGVRAKVKLRQYKQLTH